MKSTLLVWYPRSCVTSSCWPEQPHLRCMFALYFALKNISLLMCIDVIGIQFTLPRLQFTKRLFSSNDLMKFSHPPGDVDIFIGNKYSWWGCWQRRQISNQIPAKLRVTAKFPIGNPSWHVLSVQLTLTNLTAQIFKLVTCFPYNSLCKLQRLSLGDKSLLYYARNRNTCGARNRFSQVGNTANIWGRMKIHLGYERLYCSLTASLQKDWCTTVNVLTLYIRKS